MIQIAFTHFVCNRPCIVSHTELEAYLILICLPNLLVYVVSLTVCLTHTCSKPLCEGVVGGGGDTIGK